MATSGTTSFALTNRELVDEAFERCGIANISGYQLRSAMRSMNLLTQEMANRGINMWTENRQPLTLVAGQATYTLPPDTVDVLDGSISVYYGIQDMQSDLKISRISASEYLQQTSKTYQGRPLRYLIERKTDGPTITFWPVPDATADWTFLYNRLREIQDTSFVDDTPDMPTRILPAFVAGLAFEIGKKNPKALAENGIQLSMLQLEYEAQWQRAADEDRERADLMLIPSVK